MKRALIVLLKVLISALLFWFFYLGVNHGSSAAFELGLVAGLFGLLHWIFWG
jgi:hypothetical protein